MEKRRVTAAEYNRIKREYDKAKEDLKAAISERKRELDNESGYDEKLLAETGSLLHDIVVLDNRVKRYEEELSKIEIGAIEKGDPEIVNYGDVITIAHSDGAVRTAKLVSVLMDHLNEISTASPAGKAILGKKLGDVCEFVTGNREKRSVKILKIEKAAELENENA